MLLPIGLFFTMVVCIPPKGWQSQGITKSVLILPSSIYTHYTCITNVYIFPTFLYMFLYIYLIYY
jgi:hypothetical protein